MLLYRFQFQLIYPVILSPSCFAHDLNDPVSIVGDKAGRVIFLKGGKLPDEAYRINKRFELTRDKDDLK
jgi:predicted transcriptional regulator